jgi:hypothetical protein
MSQIKINDLTPTGMALFSDEESYMYILDENSLEASLINGGCTPFFAGMLVGSVIFFALV